MTTATPLTPDELAEARLVADDLETLGSTVDRLAALRAKARP